MKESNSSYSKLSITVLAVFFIGVFQITGTITSITSRHPYRQARQNSFICTTPGFKLHPTGNVSQYYQCARINRSWHYYIYDCPRNSGFVAARERCVLGVTNAPIPMPAEPLSSTSMAPPPSSNMSSSTSPPSNMSSATP